MITTTKKRPKFEPDVCECCQQTTNYPMALDKGTAFIVLAVCKAQYESEDGKVHLLSRAFRSPDAGGFESYHEMLNAGYLTFRMVGNATRAVRHGLIYMVVKGSGEYALTRKGAQFLSGEPVPRLAVIDKATHTLLRYENPEEDTTTFSHCMRKEPNFWRMDLDYLKRMV